MKKEFSVALKICGELRMIRVVADRIDCCSRIAGFRPLLVWSVFTCGLYLTFYPAAHGQSSSSRTNLHGLEAAEIEKSFGVADQKRGSESGRETWSYGRSIILFRDGKVSAWSDAGELTRRMKLAKVRVRDSQAKLEREMWKTPWTSQPRLSNSELLENILTTAAKRQPEKAVIPTNAPQESKVKLSQESETPPTQ